MAQPTAYLVIAPSYEHDDIRRVYLDRAEAEAFVAANQAAGTDYLDIEEMPIGAPNAQFDGPVYKTQWITRRKLAGEKQLVLVGENGFTTVVPSAIPTGAGTYRYHEMFAPGPSWHDLAQPEYEEPAVWIDSFYTTAEWHTGDMPPAAELVTREEHRVVVRGHDKDAVDRLCREVASVQAVAVRGTL